jgi:hypothetical protein
MFPFRSSRCRQQTEKYPIKLFGVLDLSRSLAPSKRIIFFGFQVGHFYLLRFNHYLCFVAEIIAAVRNQRAFVV